MRSQHANRLRRTLIVLLGIVLAGVLGYATRQGDPKTIAGEIDEFRKIHRIPGGVVAYGNRGRLQGLLAMGVSDPINESPMTVDQIFRIASLSKPLTGAALVALERQGRISLDDPLRQYIRIPDGHDPRLSAITLRSLLSHTAGFDRRASFDPMLQPERLGLGDDADCADVASAVLRALPLDFPPGDRQAYSNVGYCLLSEVIARITGKGYFEAARDLLEIDALTTEGRDVFHWGRQAGSWRALYVDPGEEQFFRRLAGAGGWQADARTFWQFAAGLQPAQKAAPSEGASPHDYYALGWRVWPGADGVQLTHSGFLPGIFAFAAVFSNGTTVVALFNGGVGNGLAAFDDLFARLCGLQDLTCTQGRR